MKVVYEWLKEFVDVAVSPEELASRLALTGTNIGGVEKTAQGAVIDAEITSNRPDCLGHLGIAREVSAIYKLPLKIPAPAPVETATPTKDFLRVAIEAPELCGRFTARVISGVKIQPSPQWLKNRLEACGVASINNVVDATNYVLLELGQPLHAFDYDKVREHRLVVRRAKPGEKIITLDGAERTLTSEMSVVCDGDGSRAVGIGGIMGGAETEISFATRNVVIESASFDPIAVRRATRVLRLHTEASTRFGRGADPEIAELASRRCAELILQLAGGQLHSEVLDLFPGRKAPKIISVTRAEFLRVMGADIPDADVQNILQALGFSPRRSDQQHAQSQEHLREQSQKPAQLLAAWECTQPSWRADVEREIDLIEELARIYGLDKFPPRIPAAREGAQRLPHFAAESRLRELLVGLGYREILTIPHVAEERNEIFRPESATAAKLANPLSAEAGVLRSTGAVSMVGALEWNLNHGQRDARLFEISRHYRLRPSASGGGENAVDGKSVGENVGDGKSGRAGESVGVETAILTLGATGKSREENVYEAARDFTFADLKGDVDAIGRNFATLQWESGGPAWMNAAQRGTIELDGDKIGGAGLLAKRVAERLKLRHEVFIAEMGLEKLYREFYKLKETRRCRSLPRFPSVERDFSLLLSEGTSFAQVAAEIRALQIAEIESVEPTDLFRGKGVPEGKYSLLVKVVFQNPETTLTDAQIGEFSSRIVSALQTQLGAQLRAN